MIKKYVDKFNISGKVCIVTGGGGLIGLKHAEAIVEGDGIPVLIDIRQEGMNKVCNTLRDEYGEKLNVETFVADIADKNELQQVCAKLVSKYGHVDILINNAANNPKVEGGADNLGAIQFHNFPEDVWNKDIMVGLTGAFLCAQVFGNIMEIQGSGVILNISSDYGLIAPDQRVYRKEGLAEEQQIIKPVSYSVVKHGIIGLTKYLAIYWAKKGIRVNTLCPASLANGQDQEFVEKISNLIPMGRMSDPDEYVCTILYMISDASTYMTGATVVLDGGRTSW